MALSWTLRLLLRQSQVVDPHKDRGMTVLFRYTGLVLMHCRSLIYEVAILRMCVLGNRCPGEGECFLGFGSE